MTILDIMLTILWSSLIVLAIVIVWWIIYAVLWKAYFYPINKKINTDERRSTLNKEFNRIDAKVERMSDELDILRAEYAEAAVAKNDTEREIERKQKLLKSYDDELRQFRKWKSEGAPKAKESIVDKLIEDKNKVIEVIDAKINDEIKAKPKKKKN